MNVINRIAAVITPKEPYLKWANAAATSYETLADMENSSTVILLPTHVYNNQEKYLRENYQRIFELELQSWISDRRTWPKQLDYDTFSQWFDVRFYALVIDSAENNLLAEPYH